MKEKILIALAIMLIAYIIAIGIAYIGLMPEEKHEKAWYWQAVKWIFVIYFIVYLVVVIAILFCLN